MSKCNPAVPKATLSKIWLACDTAKAGKLNKPQLVKMFGCIGQVQAGMPPNPAAYTTAPAPKIDGLPIPGSGAHAAASPPAPSAAATSSIAVPPTRQKPPTPPAPPAVDDDDDGSDYYRFIETEDSATATVYKGKFRIPADFVPQDDCRLSLLLAGDALGVSRLQDIVEDVVNRLDQDGIAITHPEYNSRFAMYMYTCDAQYLSQSQQFFAVLNTGLRARQDAWFRLWMPFMYYLTKALRTLPDVETTVYKGMRMPSNVDKYDGKKKVHWSGFSSTTTDESIARGFAGVGGLVLKIDIQNGKNVQPFSWFGTDEAELVLTPNMEFMVCRAGKAAKKPYVVDGITYIDLLQLPSETLYS